MKELSHGQTLASYTGASARCKFTTSVDIPWQAAHGVSYGRARLTFRRQLAVLLY